MTQGYGSGHAEEGGPRPSGRGAVAERLAGRDQGGAHEIDLTDEAAAREQPEEQQPEEQRSASTSIFDVDERAKQEDLQPTGYEPPVSDTDPDGPRGETVVTEPGQPRDQAAGAPGSLLGTLDAGEIHGRFLDIQAGFVDEPRQAVEEAGRFVDDLIRQVVDALQAQRGQLAGPAPEGDTEDLRQALRAYRQFVDRLLGLAG